MSKGLCCECDVIRLPQSNLYCEYHYIKTTANNNLKGSNESIIKFLLQELEKQNFLCPYTGEKLILGVNAQLDHIYPISRFPELRGNLNNVEWVSKQANLAKRDMTKIEFIAFCQLVTSRHSSNL